jgi:hypothetical protein
MVYLYSPETDVLWPLFSVKQFPPNSTIISVATDSTEVEEYDEEGANATLIV